MILMIAVAAVLIVTLAAVRRLTKRHHELERNKREIESELARHREIARSILRELQNP